MTHTAAVRWVRRPGKARRGAESFVIIAADCIWAEMTAPSDRTAGELCRSTRPGQRKGTSRLPGRAFIAVCERSDSLLGRCRLLLGDRGRHLRTDVIHVQALDALDDLFQRARRQRARLRE